MTTELTIPPTNIPGGGVWAPPEKAVDGDGQTHNTIQSAVDQDTGTVFVGPGTFTENVTIPDNSDQQGGVMYGVGETSLIDGDDDHALTINADQVGVHDIGLKTSGGNGNNADALNASSEELSVVNLVVVDSDRHGVNSKSGHAFVLSCRIRKADSIAVRADGVRSVVSSNYIGGPSSQVQGNGVNILSGANNVFGNLLENVSDDAVMIESGADDASVFGNMARQPTGDGIRSDATGTLIHGNVIVSPGGQAVNTTSATTPSVRDNVPESANDPSIETLDLGGADGSVSPVRKGQNPLTILVDAGGSASELEGIGNVAVHGQRVVVQRTGGENITLSHNDGSASNPLLNTSGGDETLDANDEIAEYHYDGNSWRQLATNIV